MLRSFVLSCSSHLSGRLGVWLTLVCACLLVVACGNGDDCRSTDCSTSSRYAGGLPAITTPPASLTVSDGDAAVFSATATGTPAPAYQWLRDGKEIAGATSARYTLGAAQLADSGASFSVKAFNAGGSVTSAAAVLTVRQTQPTVRLEVASVVTVLAGDTTTLSVATSGSAPLQFQWRRNGVAIDGATRASYTTPATVAATDNNTVYDVVISNAAGTVISPAITLNVSDTAVAPVIATAPAALTVRIGDSATFTVIASGTGTLSYQWRRDGQDIAGAQAATYTMTGATLADSGASFDVTVTNSAGSITSPAAALTVLPQPGISLMAGNLGVGWAIGAAGSADGTGANAAFNLPVAVATDSAGNAFVVDIGNQMIRKVTPAGVVTTLAGAPGSAGSNDGTGAAASFSNPSALAVDGSGNVYVADTDNHLIRKITAAGVVSTLAGSANASGSQDGTGSGARFNRPAGIAVTASGTVYVADTDNQIIRQISSAGVVTTLAGAPAVIGTTDGAGSAATFYGPSGLALDSAGNLYVADRWASTIRKIAPGGGVTTLAGTPNAPGYVDGTGSAASFSSPVGLSTDAADNVYVADSDNHVIRRITPAGVVSTLAGQAATPGPADGTAGAARFSAPKGVTTDSGGNLLIADTGNNTIRRITPAAAVTTLAGTALVSGSADGVGGAASFSNPYGLVADRQGNVYVADFGNSVIRRIAPDRTVTTFAGTAGQAGFIDGTGTAARLANPFALAIDGQGNLYVSDFSNFAIRRITPAGVVTTVAGSPTQTGSADGPIASASFSGPTGMAVDATGAIYVSEIGNAVVRKISAGVVSTLAGSAGQTGHVDGTGSAARFTQPYSLALDSVGNVLVTDYSDNVLRKITPTGEVSTLAGTAGTSGASDGPGAAASFNNAVGIAIDNQDMMYITERGNHLVRKVTPAGVVTTVAGVTDGRVGASQGALPGYLALPTYVAIGPYGELYVTEANGIVRIVLP